MLQNIILQMFYTRVSEMEAFSTLQWIVDICLVKTTVKQSQGESHS